MMYIFGKFSVQFPSPSFTLVITRKILSPFFFLKEKRKKAYALEY